MLLAQTQKESFLPSIDKENHALNANIAARKTNFLIKKHHGNKVAAKSLGRNILQPSFEENQVIPKSKFSYGNQNMKDMGLAKRINANKVKKLLNFEKDIYNGKKEYVNALSFKEKQMILPPKSKFSFLNRNVNKDGQPLETGRRSTGLNRVKPDLNDVKEEPINFAFLKELQANAEKSMLAESSDGSDFIEGPTVDPVEQTNKMVRDYANDIIATLKEKDDHDKAIYCLKNHKISANLRAKMVDWMIEVMCSYKCSDQSFFLAVNLMDAFLDRVETSQTPNDLHLLGVTCMFIAGKFEEIYPMRLSLICEKVAHGKLSRDEIMAKEGEILNTLGFNLSFATINDFITNVIFQLNLKEMMSSDLYDYLLKVCTYLSKANTYDYELLSQYSFSQLAASTLLVAFKVIEQLDLHFPLATMMFKVCEILEVDDSILYGCAGKILALVKGFDRLYPSFKNLKKFHFIGLPGDDRNNEEAINQGVRIISNL